MGICTESAMQTLEEINAQTLQFVFLVGELFDPLASLHLHELTRIFLYVYCSLKEGHVNKKYQQHF